ncbi:hypothetical protein ABZ793_09750 [Micromonospora sp. NPDC047465]
MSTDEGVRVWLRRHGAEQIAHPGGNLFASWAPLAPERLIRDAQRVVRP